MSQQVPSKSHQRRRLSILGSIARHEGGFSLAEVLVVVALLVVVTGALLVPLVTSDHFQSRDAEYAYVQQNARTGLDSMVRQIRQAYAVLSTTPNAIEFDVSLSGVDYHVYYECDVPQPNTSYRECVRLQAPAGVGLPALSTGKVVVTNLTNGTLGDPVFTFTPDAFSPTFVTATVKVPASGGTSDGLTHSIVLSDGVLLRNQTVGD